MNTIYLIITLFGLAAVAGMYLLAMVLQRKETSKLVAFVHGLFAAVALVLLVAYAIKNEAGYTASIVLFVLAALGGFVLLFRDLTGKTIPRWLAVAHGIIAVTGFLMLVINVF